MKRVLGTVAVAAALAASSIAPAMAQAPAHHARASNFTVGLVTDIGGINDKGFNHLAYVGLQVARAKYHIGGSYVESHSQTDYVPNLTHFARAHASITIGVGFLMDNAIYQVATAYPKQKFAIVDGNPVDNKGNNVHLKNVAEIHFKEQESGYLVGVIAGLMEKQHVGRATHNIVGTMGGLSIPPVNRYIAGYVAGVKKVDPSAQIIIGYSQSFTDLGKCKSVGQTQVSRNADILFAVAGGCGLGYMAAAQQTGRYAIGVDADQGYLGKYVITSAVKKVDVAVRSIVRDAMTGRFRGGDHEFDLKNGATGYAPTSSLVPASIRAAAQHYASLIKSGQIVPPTNVTQ